MSLPRFDIHIPEHPVVCSTIRCRRSSRMTTVDPSGQSNFQMIVARHIARYPAMRLEDVYKLAHQACLGSEHAVPDKAHAQRWLERELAQLSDGPPEPMLDPISPDASILRVHFRPFLSGGGDPVRLVEAFVRTANEYRGCTAQLRSCWASVEGMAAAGHLPFLRTDAQAYWHRIEANGYPAVRHSAVYEAAYRPAYRVVAREFLPESLRAALT